MRNDIATATGVRPMAVVILLALSAITTWATTKGPDAGGYTATDATVYSFVDIGGASGGTSVLSGTDDGTAVLTLPFPFTFYGQAYTLACVSSNGALYFVAAAGACSGFNDFANTDLTATTPPNDLPGVFPLWSDLTFDAQGAGAVFYQTLGTAGSRKFVVQWHNAYPQGTASPVTFQLVLLEGTNNLLFQYQSVGAGQGPASNGAQATIGIRNAGALTTQQQTAWSFDAPVVADNTALLFTAASAASTTTARMDGAGRSDAAGVTYGFDFHIQQSTHVAERGKLTLHAERAGPPRRGDEFLSSSVDTVTFTDDPQLRPTRGPKATTDSASFSGTGRWNGAAGYTFTAQASDAGEPGRGRDQFTVTVRSPQGAVVASVSGPITDGNIQSSRLR